ncbi:unnamed protein product [Pleuronectes platessa]|uniref:Uncharacterized protein n=1 Tax=Pleuronectes platessa TaxID=8262 RepID=A0A9N7UXY8_PLEPL|nr:unnamed protein product [Pleuronectes platessa]
MADVHKVNGLCPGGPVNGQMLGGRPAGVSHVSSAEGVWKVTTIKRSTEDASVLVCNQIWDHFIIPGAALLGVTRDNWEALRDLRCRCEQYRQPTGSEEYDDEDDDDDV